MFVEFFVHMDCVLAYDDIPWGELIAIIGEDKYGPRDTLASIGLYGGWYTIEFRPGELSGCHLVMFDCCSSNPVLYITGVNYDAREGDNEMLEIECCQDDS